MAVLKRFVCQGDEFTAIIYASNGVLAKMCFERSYFEECISCEEMGIPCKAIVVYEHATDIKAERR